MTTKVIMRYTGIQPQYFPRLHYFARMLNTDVFMIRDDCQYVRNHKYPDGKRGSSYQAETPIKFTMGQYFLKLPISHEGRLPIVQTHVNYQEKWIYSHIGTLQTAYGKALNFKKLWQELKLLIAKQHSDLAELNNSTIFWGILHLLGEDDVSLEKLNLDYVNRRLASDDTFRLSEIRTASESPLFSKLEQMDANHKILAFIREVGASEDYCGGTAHDAYMNEVLFGENGVKITVQDWKCATYSQTFEKQEFIPNLSIIDLLMNVPHAEAVKVIKG